MLRPALNAPLSAVEERERRSLTRDHAFLDPPPAVSYRAIAPVDELALIARYQAGDGRAGRALLALHGGFIAKMTQRLSRRIALRADLYQVARLGFLRAVAQYDRTNGARLTTYAAPKIRNAVARTRNLLVDDVYVPLHIRDAIHKILTLGRETPEGRAYGEQVPHAREVIDLDYGAESFDTPAAEGRHGLAETLASPHPTPEEQVMEVDHRRWAGEVVTGLLTRMSARSRRVITLRYLKGLSCADVAAQLGCCTMNVYQIEKKALAWMRGQLAREHARLPADRATGVGWRGC